MPTLRVPIWRGPDTDQDHLDTAVTVLTDELAPQIPVPVETTRKGSLELPGAPFDSYREYLEGFEDEADLEAGAVNLCLYSWGPEDALFDAILDELEARDWVSCSDDDGKASGKIDHEPWCGFDVGSIAPGHTPRAVVNTAWDLPFVRAYENLVIHEALHAVLDNANAPQAGNDHSYGTIHDGEASPMLTGYVESVSSNPTPDRACGLDTVPEVNEHTTTLSECTIDEVERRMEAAFPG